MRPLENSHGVAASRDTAIAHFPLDQIEEGHARKDRQTIGLGYEADLLGLDETVFMCRRWLGEITGREGQQLAWVSTDEIGNYPAPAADVPLFERFVEWSKVARI